jgi:hypothetical protein
MGAVKKIFINRIMLAGAIGWSALVCSGAAQVNDNWPHWRGPHDNGSTAQGTDPVKWDSTNVLWKVWLPGKGYSTPVVWDRRGNLYWDQGTLPVLTEKTVVVARM